MTQPSNPYLPEDRLYASEWDDRSPIYFGGLDRPDQLMAPVHKRQAACSH
jgi:hypothetical protein